MKRKKGFTLIELLVVVAIISLLVSILVPSLQKAKELAKATVCMSNLRGIGSGIAMYASENSSKLPYQSWWTNGAMPEALTCSLGGNGLGLVALENFWGEVTYNDLLSPATKPKLLRCPTELGCVFFDSGATPNCCSYTYQTPAILSNGSTNPDGANTLEAMLPGQALVMDCVQNWVSMFQAPAHVGDTTGVLYSDGHVDMKPWQYRDPTWLYGVFLYFFNEN